MTFEQNLDLIEERFEELFEKHDDMFGKYMDFILENADPSEVAICDGDSLIIAAEKGYLFDEFRDAWLKENNFFQK